jgi:hypothetical protein
MVRREHRRARAEAGSLPALALSGGWGRQLGAVGGRAAPNRTAKSVQFLIVRVRIHSGSNGRTKRNCARTAGGGISSDADTIDEWVEMDGDEGFEEPFDSVSDDEVNARYFPDGPREYCLNATKQSLSV